MGKLFRCEDCGKEVKAVHATGHECNTPTSFEIDESRSFIIKDKAGNRATLDAVEAQTLLRDLHEFFHGED